MGLFKNRKRTEIDKTKIPNHIAFIVDGNGRWANKRGLPRTVGHKYGVEAVKNTIFNSYDLGIKVISFFTFSTENWKRPKEEIDAIFNILREYLNENLDEYIGKGIKIITCGDISKLPKDIFEAILNAKEKTKNCDKMIVNMAINYGGRDDIITAVNKIISEKVNKVDEKSFANYLYTNQISDPDFIIRTSGEYRISNFMLYQGAYSELYFTKTYWPDFDKNELIIAIKDFQGRNRRFGKISTKE